MTEHKEQFDDLERQISDGFRADLKALFEPTGSVPPQVDRAIVGQARRHFARPRRLIIRLRWAAGIAAAAAVVAVGVVLYNAGTPTAYQPAESQLNGQITAQRFSPGMPAAVPAAGAEGRADVDSNGRVDIRDAFRLARHIESRGRIEARWDLNGDGRIDRADVDLVAFAAVRLDKGV
jgi:hypothetical protein